MSCERHRNSSVAVHRLAFGRFNRFDASARRQRAFVRTSFFRSAEALLPPHKCGGSRGPWLSALALRNVADRGLVYQRSGRGWLCRAEMREGLKTLPYWLAAMFTSGAVSTAENGCAKAILPASAL